MLEQKQLYDSKMQEYILLREEMNEEMKAQQSIYNVCLTTVSALFAFAFAQKSSMVLLAAHILIMFFLSQNIRHTKRIMHISGYMIVYLEHDIGINWETYNSTAYTAQEATVKKQFIKYFHYHFWWILSCFSMISALILDITNKTLSINFSKDLSNALITLLVYLIHIAAVVLIGCLSYSTSKSHEKRRKSIDYWKNVKKNIDDNIWKPDNP